jgi:hypothetical protein
LAQGHTIAETAELTCFAPRWIEELLARYNALGPQALGHTDSHLDCRAAVGPENTLLEAGDLNLENTKPKSCYVRILRSPKIASTRRRELLRPAVGLDATCATPRSGTRATLVASIARGRRWLAEFMTSPTANLAGIAQREGCSVRRVSTTISLARQGCH